MRYADSTCQVVSVGDSYIVKGNDVFTGRAVEVKIPGEALWQYRQGSTIQDSMHMITPDEREFLMSGIYEGFEELFEDE